VHWNDVSAQMRPYLEHTLPDAKSTGTEHPSGSWILGMGPQVLTVPN
jgi:hypothetical protein